VTQPPSLPPRGWYPDPGGTEAWRWWDGQKWSDDLEPYQRKQAAVPTPSLLPEQLAAKALVPAGVVLLSLSAVLGALLSSLSMNDSAALMHWAGRAFSAALHQQSAPTPPSSTSASWISTLSLFVVEPARILGIVFLLRFQFRAAKIARSLGFSQRLSPALGVWGWFIPFANFVLPYLAWRDLLPVNHPVRRQIFRAWILLICGEIGLIGSLPLAGASIPAARGLLFLGLLCLLGALRLLPSLIGAIGAAHQAHSQSGAPPAHESPFGA